VRISDSLRKKKKDYKKSSTAKLSADAINESPPSTLNSYNLLKSEEKRQFLTLAKKLIILDENLNKNYKLWRYHVKLLESIKNNIELFPVSEFWLLFQETLIEYIKEGNRPIQKASIELLAAMILYNYDIEEADNTIDGFLNEFSESENSYHKKIFIDFFVACWNLPYTISWIEDKLFEPLIGVSKCAFKSVKLHILTAIPNIKYLLTDSDILEEVQTMLMNFMEEKSQEVVMKTDEMNLLLFKWKKDAQTAEGKEEQRQFDEERDLREEILKAKIKKNKALIEERKKKEEEEEQLSMGRLGLRSLGERNGLDRRGHSGSKTTKGKKMTKQKTKIYSSKISTKGPKKLRRNTINESKKPNSAVINSFSNEEFKDDKKRNSVLIPENSKKTVEKAKTGAKIFRKQSDPFDYNK
jgi:hypothetical protein